MQSIFKISLLLIAVSFIAGCQKEKTEISLKNTESYYCSFSVGDEEGASIKVQAKHYEISELNRDRDEVVYHYKPKTDFVGKDYVIIEVHRNKTGVGAGYTETVKINFTVTE